MKMKDKLADIKAYCETIVREYGCITDDDITNDVCTFEQDYTNCMYMGKVSTAKYILEIMER